MEAGERGREGGGERNDYGMMGGTQRLLTAVTALCEKKTRFAFSLFMNFCEKTSFLSTETVGREVQGILTRVQGTILVRVGEGI